MDTPQDLADYKAQDYAKRNRDLSPCKSFSVEEESNIYCDGCLWTKDSHIVQDDE